MEKASRPSKLPKRSKGFLSASNLVKEVEDLGGELCGVLEPRSVIDSLPARLVERYGAVACGIWLVKEDPASLDLASRIGKVELPADLGKGTTVNSLLSRAITHRLPQTLTNCNGEDEVLARWARQHRVKFLGAYPLLDDSRVQGVLLVAYHRTPAKPLLALFRLHARLASMALRDAELLHSTRRTLNKLSFLVEASKALTPRSTFPNCWDASWMSPRRTRRPSAARSFWWTRLRTRFGR